MRILIANHMLDAPAGSETYVLTLAGELMRRGHEVVCFSPHLGEVATRLRAMGAATVSDAREAGEADVIHASHLDATHLALAAWPLTPVVFVVHGAGIREVLERPPAPRGAVERWVAVSELVAQAMTSRDGIDRSDIAVIPNFVDLERFAPLIPTRSPPRTVLLVCNHQDPGFHHLVEEACARAGMQLRYAGGPRRRSDMASELLHCDVVISLGRGAIEALACGRPVIVLSQFGGDGLLTPEAAAEQLASNYCGSVSRVIPSADELADQLRGATREVGEWGRSWAEEHHDARRVVDALVSRYEEAIESAAGRRQRDGDLGVLYARHRDFYPSLRWWHQVADRFDSQRAAFGFPVWAPDASEELEALLGGLRSRLEEAQRDAARAAEAAEEAQRRAAEAEEAGARWAAMAAEAERRAEESERRAEEAGRRRDDLESALAQTAEARDQARRLLEAIAGSRTWRLRTRLYGAPFVGPALERAAVARARRSEGSALDRAAVAGVAFGQRSEVSAPDGAAAGVARARRSEGSAPDGTAAGVARVRGSEAVSAPERAEGVARVRRSSGR